MFTQCFVTHVSIVTVSRKLFFSARMDWPQRQLLPCVLSAANIPAVATPPQFEGITADWKRHTLLPFEGDICVLASIPLGLQHGTYGTTSKNDEIQGLGYLLWELR